MKQFIDKLIERLEYLLNNFGEHCEEWGSDQEGECNRKSCSDCVLRHAIEIVNQIAEEHINSSTDTSTDLAIVQSLPSLYPLQAFEEEAVHRVVEMAKSSNIQTIDVSELLGESVNDGWIACSERFPEERFFDDGYVEPSEAVLVLTKYNSYKVSRYWGNRRNKRDYHDWVDIEYRKNEVIAWKPIAPYQPKGE